MLFSSPLIFAIIELLDNFSPSEIFSTYSIFLSIFSKTFFATILPERTPSDLEIIWHEIISVLSLRD